MNLVDLLKNNLNNIYEKYFKNEDNPIFYIAGSQTLPPPLPEEEEMEYIKKLSDDDNLDHAHNRLYANIYLVSFQL